MDKPKVSIELISRLIDGELSPEQTKQVELLVEQCDISRKLLQSMREFTSEFGQAVMEAPVLDDNTRTDNCLDQSTLMLLAEGTLSKAKLKEAELHAVKCPRCLKLILQETRSQVGMSRDNWKDLPDEVKADPRLGGIKYRKPAHKPKPRPQKEPEEKPEDTSFDFECSASDKAKKSQTFINGDYSLQITSKGLRSGLTLEIRVKRNGKPLEQSEVTISENVTARKIFRGLTASSTGMLMVRRLHRGRYMLHLPAAAIEVNLFIES